jgi:hypothetical protein
MSGILTASAGIISSGKIVSSGLSLYLTSYAYTSGLTWLDQSGNGNNGTLVNGPAFTTVDGVKCFGFDGVDDRVSFSYQTPIQTSSTAFTWCAWVRCNRNTDGDLIMGYRGGAGPPPFAKMTSQKMEFYPAEVFYVQATNTWLLMTGIYNGAGTSAGSNLQWYLNNASVGLRTGGDPILNSSTMPFNVGGDAVAGEYFHGYISAVAVYNRALSSSEVTQNYNATKSIYGF